MSKASVPMQIVSCSHCPGARPEDDTDGNEWTCYLHTGARRLPVFDENTPAPKWCPLRSADFVMTFGSDAP